MVSNLPFVCSVLVSLSIGGFSSGWKCDGSNEVTRLSPPVHGSMALLAVRDSVAVFSVSSYTHTPSLCVAKLDVNKLYDVNYVPLSLVPVIEEHAVRNVDSDAAYPRSNELDWRVHRFDSGNEIIYIRPVVERDDQKLPLVCFPHGGPHSATTVGFSVVAELLARYGIATVMVNYRGSTGMGQDLLEALPGKCGTVDVHDCIEAVEWAIEHGSVRKERQNVSSGGKTPPSRVL